MGEAAEKGIDPNEISLEICIQCETFNRGTVEPYGSKLFSGFPQTPVFERN